MTNDKRTKFVIRNSEFVICPVIGVVTANRSVLALSLRKQVFPRLLEELGKIRLVDVVLPISSGMEIRKRCITRPTEHQEILLQYLGLKIPRQFKK